MRQFLCFKKIQDSLSIFVQRYPYKMYKTSGTYSISVRYCSTFIISLYFHSTNIYVPLPHRHPHFMRYLQSVQHNFFVLYVQEVLTHFYSKLQYKFGQDFLQTNNINKIIRTITYPFSGLFLRVWGNDETQDGHSYG